MLSMSSNMHDASASIDLRTQKSTLSQVRRMASAAALLKGYAAFVTAGGVKVAVVAVASDVRPAGELAREDMEVWVERGRG